MIAYVRTVAPTAEPLTVAEVKAHLRLSGNTEDLLLATYLTAARRQMEATLGIAFLTQTWQAIADYQDAPSGGDDLLLRGYPLASVSSIAYVDIAGAAQTWASANYTVDTAACPGRVYPTYNVDWPSVRDQRKALTVTYVCGYTAATLVPEPLLHALKLLVGHFYEHREATQQGQPILDVPRAYDALALPFKAWRYT